jgi:acyl-coenzyme A thioesterase 13
MVDLGGSLAVASRGLFATGVSTDLNGKQGFSASTKQGRLTTDLHTVTYLASGGKIGDIIRAEVTCDKCTYERPRETESIRCPDFLLNLKDKGEDD